MKPTFVNGNFKWYKEDKYQRQIDNEQAENLPKLNNLYVFRVVNEKESIDDYVVINNRQEALFAYPYTPSGAEQLEARYMKNFNEYCVKVLDRFYTPNIPLENQSSGYKQLRLMVQEQIIPATKEETERWEKHPTILELGQIPKTKYMRSLHPLLRDYVRNNWETIKNLEL